MNTENNEELNNIRAFLDLCDGMAKTNFLLFSYKTEHLLEIISKTESLYTLIKECSQNFNFDEEYNKALVKNPSNKGVFKMPFENRKVIAFTFCLLMEFYRKKIDFSEFLQSNFYGLEVSDYDGFINAVIIPFKCIIAQYYGLIEETSEYALDNVQETIEPEEPEEDVFDNIEVVIKKLIEQANAINSIFVNDKKKNDIIYVLKGMRYSLKYKDMKLVNNFLTCLNVLVKNITQLKSTYNELTNIVLDYYKNQQNI